MPEPVFHHAGMVVEDLEQAMESFSGALGLTWTQLRRVQLPVHVAGGRTIVVAMMTTFSADGPPYLELIQRQPGTPWDVSTGLHHIGFWSEDVATDSARLEAIGLPWSAGQTGSAVDPFMAYHRQPAGSFLELLSCSLKPVFAKRLQTRA